VDDAGGDPGSDAVTDAVGEPVALADVVTDVDGETDGAQGSVAVRFPGEPPEPLPPTRYQRVKFVLPLAAVSARSSQVLDVYRSLTVAALDGAI
jgi:hypothetical protein